MILKYSDFPETAISKSEAVQGSRKLGVDDKAVFGKADSQNVLDELAQIDARAAGIEPPPAVDPDGSGAEQIKGPFILVTVMERAARRTEVQIALPDSRVGDDVSDEDGFYGK